MNVTLKQLENLSYDIMESLSRRRASVHVFLNHAVDGFQIIRASECSASLYRRKGYLHIGTYSESPLYDQILGRIKSRCKDNHIKVSK